jgi:uncharacterized surface protein with fasciclin (FAS1) repeats
MNKLRWQRTAIAGIAALALFGAACGDDDDSTASSATSEATTATTEMTPTTEAMADGPTGPACGAVPADGEGSFTGMADDPAATAASNNPELTTLVQAVSAAGLVDTLNGEGPFTIFAPVNSAFAAIPAADLNAVLADKEMLTSILTLHVVGDEQLDAAMLEESSSVTTLNGETISVATDGDVITLDGTAKVVCGNIKTANATVYLIDTVMMPQG